MSTIGCIHDEKIIILYARENCVICVFNLLHPVNLHNITIIYSNDLK